MQEGFYLDDIESKTRVVDEVSIQNQLSFAIFEGFLCFQNKDKHLLKQSSWQSGFQRNKNWPSVHLCDISVTLHHDGSRLGKHKICLEEPTKDPIKKLGSNICKRIKCHQPGLSLEMSYLGKCS
jgi:hypothetical protein